MLSRKNALAGLFSRNDHQPARSRARAKVAVNLEMLESRELLNAAYPKLQAPRNDASEFRKINLNAELSHGISKTEFHVMHLARDQSNTRQFPQFRGGGPTFPAPQITPTKVPLGSLGIGSPILFSLPTIAKNHGTQVNVHAPSGPAMTLIRTPVSSLPTQPGSPGIQPVNAAGGGAPTSSAPASPSSAPIVHIDKIPSGSMFSGPVLF